MRIPLSWLREFVPVGEDAPPLMDRLAMLGFGHEPVDRLGDEVIFDLEVASNRPDLLSVLGVAREIAAALGRDVRVPRDSLRTGHDRAAAAATVAIDESTWCPRYTAHILTGVRVGPSPARIAQRLEACGIRAINNVVDVTNYVMLERGQPLHAFDLDRLAGPRIIVRRARAGEVLTTLDGVTRTVDPDMLVIADAERAVALAGIMGGADTEIGPRTSRVLLEAAAFDGPQVRRTARRLGLRTESSARFERSPDPESVLGAARRAAALLAEVTGGVVLAEAIDVYPNPALPREVVLRPARIERILGTTVPAADVRAILRRLGCRVSGRGARWTVRIPPGRVDLQREEDLIEEVARHHGYDRIPEAMPLEVVQAGSVAPVLRAEAAVRDVLVRAGLNEAMTLSLIAPAVLERLGISPEDPASRPLPLRNPLLADHTHLRSSLLPGLLEAMRVNLSRRVEDVHLFEIGRVFRATDTGGVAERRSLAIALRGRLAHGWNLTPETVDVTFFHLKGVLEDLCGVLRVQTTAEPAAPSWLHPGRGARLLRDGSSLGLFGELHPAAAERFDLQGRVYVAEVDLEALLQGATLVARFEPPPRYPSVDRDLAVFVRDEIPQAEVRRTLVAAAGPLLESADLFDVYTGEQAPSGSRSLAYRLRFRAPDRTLTADEADAVMARVLVALQERLGAIPRA